MLEKHLNSPVTQRRLAAAAALVIPTPTSTTCAAYQSWFDTANITSAIIAGDGNVYVAYSVDQWGCTPQTGISIATAHLRLAQIQQQRCLKYYRSHEFCARSGCGDGDMSIHFNATMISNADTGVVIGWSVGGACRRVHGLSAERYGDHKWHERKRVERTGREQ